MREPNSVLTVCVSDTALPSTSSTEMCVVPASFGGGVPGPSTFKRSGRPQRQGGFAYHERGRTRSAISSP